MKRFIFTSLALAASSFAPLAVSAQQVPEIDGEQQVGTRFMQEPETVEAGRARMMQKEVARCVYSRDKRDVTEILANSDFHQIDYAALDTDNEDVFKNLQISRCIGVAMRATDYRMHMSFPHSTMRNLLAEAAYLDDYRDGLTLPAGAPEKLENRSRNPRFYPPTAFISGVADCLVYRNVDAAHRLLRSRPTSEEEQQAMDDLLPTMGQCMKSDEEEITMSVSMVRQIVADGLWSRAYYGANDDA